MPETGRYWLVDPLCGTGNYAAGLPLVALNIAPVEDATVTASAVADGVTGDVYVAERGGGAWRLTANSPERLSASGASGLVSLDPNLAGPGELRAFGQAFAIRVVAAGRWDVRMLATTLVLTYVASGDLRRPCMPPAVRACTSRPDFAGAQWGHRYQRAWDSLDSPGQRLRGGCHARTCTATARMALRSSELRGNAVPA